MTISSGSSLAEVAVIVASALNEHSVDMSTIREWSRKEGFVAPFDEFARAVQGP